MVRQLMFLYMVLSQQARSAPISMPRDKHAPYLNYIHVHCFSWLPFARQLISLYMPPVPTSPGAPVPGFHSHVPLLSFPYASCCNIVAAWPGNTLVQAAPSQPAYSAPTSDPKDKQLPLLGSHKCAQSQHHDTSPASSATTVFTASNGFSPPLSSLSNSSGIPRKLPRSSARCPD